MLLQSWTLIITLTVFASPPHKLMLVTRRSIVCVCWLLTFKVLLKRILVFEKVYIINVQDCSRNTNINILFLIGEYSSSNVITANRDVTLEND